MLKVSFKETPDNPCKVVYKAGKLTTIVLKGKVKLPKFWANVPPEILDWILWYHRADVYENIVENTLIIYAEGKSRCMEGDKYDSVLGERLAESRAKLNVYTFFNELLYRLCRYYSNLVFGPTALLKNVNGVGLLECWDKYSKLCTHEGEHIKKLLETEENG